MSFSFGNVLATKRNTVVDEYVISYFAGLTDNDTNCMVDKYATTNIAGRMNVDTS